MIGAPLVARAVTLPGGALDVASPRRPARRAVRLPAIAAATDREEHAAVAAENEPVIVQEPAPDDALLARPAAIGDGPLVRDGHRRAGIGVGMLASLIGAIEMKSAANKHAAVDAVCPGLACKGDDLVAQQGVEHDAATAGRIGLASLALGGTALVGGLVLVLTSHNDAGSTRTAVLVPSVEASGAGVRLGASW